MKFIDAPNTVRAMLAPPKPVRVLFDESHSEAWTIRPDVAEAMQPSHPADSSLARAATALAEREFEVAAHTDGELDATALANAQVLVIAHPSDPKWEATVNGGSPLLSAAEIDAIEAFVSAGGGLVVLGETEQDKYGNNLNELLSRFGVTIENATVQDYEHHHHDTPSWVLASLGDSLEDGPDRFAANGSDPLAGVNRACFYRSGALSTATDTDSRPASSNGSLGEPGARAKVLARTHPTASLPNAPLAVVVDHGAGRVVVSADSDLFGDDCIGELDHRALWINLLYWAAQPGFAGTEGAERSPVLDDPAWIRLKAAVEELRLTQSADGSVDTSTHDTEKLRNLTVAIAESAQALKPRFQHQTDYIDALSTDLLAWVDGGYGKPAFDRSTEAFRPERDRRDGIEHLVVFPMYKQNASTDTCFEALVVRVPWPGWIARARVDPLRQRQVRPGHLRRSHLGLRLRVRRPLPGDLLAGLQAGRVPLRCDLLRPRGRPPAPRRRRRRRDPPPQPAAGCRLHAELARALRVRLHPLGPRPRPHAHARRPSVRPVHDPPAQPVLDVLA